ETPTRLGRGLRSTTGKLGSRRATCTGRSPRITSGRPVGVCGGRLEVEKRRRYKPVNGRQPIIVVFGMMTKMPGAGIVWLTVPYLVGLRRLGYDVYYVEAHARTPSMLMTSPDDDGAALAAGFVERIMRRFSFEHRWAYHALH